MVEHLLCKQGVVGSTPSASTTPGVEGRVWVIVGKLDWAARLGATRDCEGVCLRSA